MERRPLTSRNSRFAKSLARRLSASRITPNQISLASVFFAFAGCVCLSVNPFHPAFLVGVAVCVQLRLLCNLMDGMVAVEGGKGGKTGAFFNEAPDRLADVLFLVPLGYAVYQPWLGWALAVCAMGTAYLRAFGASLGLGEDFQGPGAKPHRMAVLTTTVLGAAIESFWHPPFWSLWFGGMALLLLTVLTLFNRTRRILSKLNEPALPVSPDGATATAGSAREHASGTGTSWT
jgi:phosphatidylglycerophosphate synthase